MSANVRTAVKLWVATRTGVSGPRLHVFGLAGVDPLEKSWCGRTRRRSPDVSTLSVLDARLFGGQITHCSSCARAVRSRYPAVAGRSAWAPSAIAGGEPVPISNDPIRAAALAAVLPPWGVHQGNVDPPCGGGKSEIGGGRALSARGDRKSVV